ncbi:MAG: hypothetical protein IT373_02435 [Polyangiaceae bacterium]|nr:hypothetical protein [Polyangiaceae bacterium]
MAALCFHAVARVSGGPPLDDDAIAPRLWRGLRLALPAALGAVLMPDHLHVVSLAAGSDAARLSLVRVLSGLRRSKGLCAEVRWETVPPPAQVPDAHHALRQVRYVALNPCRAGLAADPLAWPWSTHRDAVGAIADPWVTQERLAAVLGRPVAGLAAWFHRYVSADPSVHVAGTHPPVAAGPRLLADEPLSVIATAAAAASRAYVADIRHASQTRRLFVHLAVHAGWRERRSVARACGVSVSAVGKLLRQSVAGLDAAALCLGDARLRVLARAAPQDPFGAARPLTAPGTGSTATAATSA